MIQTRLADYVALLLGFNVCAVKNKFRRASVRVKGVPDYLHILFPDVMSKIFLPYSCITFCHNGISMCIVELSHVALFTECLTH